MTRHRHGSDPAKGWCLWMIPAVLAICVGGPASAQDADTATYSVTFTGNWTDESTTPLNDLPGSAHFTTLIGAIHNSNVTFWQSGGTASPGIEVMAETGERAPSETRSKPVRMCTPSSSKVSRSVERVPTRSISMFPRTIP